MKSKNIILWAVSIVILVCLMQNIESTSFTAYNYDTGYYYDVNVSIKLNTTTAKIYVEDNETFRTEQTDISGFSGLPHNYSLPYYWGKYTLGEWNKTIDVYYILVYDGSNNGINKYDTIAWSTDENFTNALKKNQTKKVGEQFTVSDKYYNYYNKSYTLLSIANDGKSIVLKPNFMPDVIQLKNEVERIYLNETRAFGNNSGNVASLDLLIFDINDVSIGGRCCFMELPANDWKNINCETISHEFNHKIERSYDPDKDVWVEEGLACYATNYVCGSLPWQLESFNQSPDTQLLPWGGTDAQYGADYTFIQYIADRFGHNTVKNILQDSDNSIYSRTYARQTRTLGFLSSFIR